MRIVAGTIFLAFAILLNFTEFINSEPRSLKDLFPGFNGVMPPVERLSFAGQLRNFSTFGDKHITLDPGYVFKRDHIIFGWISEPGDLIREPCRLFSRMGNVCIVFDMNEEMWVTLPCDLSRKLGARRLYFLVVARDQVAAKHKITSNDPAHKEAHTRACRQANDRVDIVEKEQLELLHQHNTTTASSISIIKREYSQEYDRAFAVYLYQHGEYNMIGHRERHT